MKIIDILVPHKWSRKRKIALFKHSHFDAISNSDWYPIVVNKKRFFKYGYKFRFYTLKNLPSPNSSNCIFIDSRLKNGKNFTWSDVKNLIKKFKLKGRKVVFFDNKDSHNILMELLPEVDYYFKKQLLKNRSLYKFNFQGGRLFTDYYAKEETGLPWHPMENSLSDYKNLFIENEYKLMLSWNILMAIDEFSSIKDYWRYFSGKSGRVEFIDPHKKRDLYLNANFSTNYKNKLVARQRIFMVEYLKNTEWVSKGSVGLISKSKFIDNLKNSKAVASPFGWGEVCYRDFETFIHGAALIKPDMGHLDTWPNLYEPNKTYIPISWDKKKWVFEFEKILKNQTLMLDISCNAQNKYKDLWNENGREKFCKRFAKILDTITSNT